MAPAWRLPREIESQTPMRALAVERLGKEHGLRCGRVTELGGRYHPSSGLTPEVVFPLAVEVLDEVDAARPLYWVELSRLLENERHVVDGHLRVVMFRAAHAGREG